MQKVTRYYDHIVAVNRIELRGDHGCKVLEAGTAAEKKARINEYDTGNGVEKQQ